MFVILHMWWEGFYESRFDQETWFSQKKNVKRSKITVYCRLIIFYWISVVGFLNITLAKKHSLVSLSLIFRIGHFNILVFWSTRHHSSQAWRYTSTVSHIWPHFPNSLDIFCETYFVYFKSRENYEHLEKLSALHSSH